MAEHRSTIEWKSSARLHHQAHDGCFIANSVKTETVIAPFGAPLAPR